MKYIKTVTGRYAPEKEVRKIKGVYYHYDDIVKISGIYNRKDNKRVVYDLDKKQWIKTTDSNHDYSYTLYKIQDRNVIGVSNRMVGVIREGHSRVISEVAAISMGLFPLSSDNYSKKRQINRTRDSGKNGYSYSYQPEQVEYQQKILSKRFLSYRNYFTPEFKQVLQNIFKSYSLGIEIETSAGFLTTLEKEELQMIPLRDGSIDNTEFCTPPLRNITDFARFLDFFKTNISVNQKCSTHIHVGGLDKKNKKMIVALYYLCYRIQLEFHNCIPAYRKSVDNLIYQKKDYCQLLNSFGFEYQAEGIDYKAAFETIQLFLKGGHTGKDHPLEGAMKWNKPMRYYYVNFLPLLFSNRGTVEFRLFPGTDNYSICLIWILLVICIVDFASNNADSILENKEKLTLKDVISKSMFPDPIKNILLEAIADFSESAYYEVITGKANFGTYIESYIELGNKYSKILNNLLYTWVETEQKDTLGKENAQINADPYIWEAANLTFAQVDTVTDV